METQLDLPGVPTPEQEERANFKLDTEASHALLVITPVHCISDEGEFDRIRVETTLEIRPYPNPYGFGGMWGTGGYAPEEEGALVARFHQEVDPWIELGLTRVEIKHGHAFTEHVPTEAQRQAMIERYRNRSYPQHRSVGPDQPALF